MTLKFVFKPVAQNTIIRPLAAAVSMARGGACVKYTDTADHKEKVVYSEDLYSLTLQTKINGHERNIDGRTVAFQAAYKPAEIHVEINDLTVVVSPKTTVVSAMAQYREKFNQHYAQIKENSR